MSSLSFLLLVASAALADGTCKPESVRPECRGGAAAAAPAALPATWTQLPNDSCDRCLALATDQRKYVSRTSTFVACLDEPTFAVGSEEAAGPVAAAAASRCAPETKDRLATAAFGPVLIGAACVPELQQRFMAGAEGAGETAGFAVAFEGPAGERACHGQHVFKVELRVESRPGDSGPRLELTKVVGEREYVADGLYFVDTRALGPAPTTRDVNVTVVPIFAHCQHTGAAYDRALEMSGCAKATAAPDAATIKARGPAAVVSSPLPRCARTALADEGGMWVSSPTCDAVVGGAPICRPGEPSPALALQHTKRMDKIFVPPRCRYRLFDADAVVACLAGKKVLVVGDSTVHGIYTEMQLIVANSTDPSKMLATCKAGGNNMVGVSGLHGIDFYPNHVPFRNGLTHFVSQFPKAEQKFLEYDHILFGSLAHDISYSKGFACGHTNFTERCKNELRGSWRLKPLLEYSKNVRLTAEWFLRLRALKPSLAITWILATHSQPRGEDVVELDKTLATYSQGRNNLVKAGNDVARTVMAQAGFDVLDAESLSSMGRRSWWSNNIHFHYCHNAQRPATSEDLIPDFSGGLGRMIAHAYLGMLCP